MVQVANEKFIIDENGKPTAVILNIETYRMMLSLIQERVDRKESKVLSQSQHFRQVVHKGLRETKEGKANPWKEVSDEF